jgi:hypothetical protein
MAVSGANTGFKITTQSGYVQDLGERYVSNDYVIDNYSNILPGRTSPGLYYFGQGTYGQNGQGNTTNYNSPIQIGTGSSEWRQMSHGYFHVLGIKKDGTLWAWGANESGQLGNGNTTYYSSPIQVGSLTTWRQVAGGGAFSVGIKTDGTMWSWGSGATYSAVGQGSGVSSSSPVQIGSGITWNYVVAGYYHCHAITTDGSLYGWGRNDVGMTTGTTAWTSPTNTGYLMKHVTCGAYHSVGISVAGYLYTWGFNDHGQIGNQNTVSQTGPYLINSSNYHIDIGATAYSSYAVRSNGTLWAWGDGSSGILGNGATTWYSSPIQVGSLTNWKKVFGGNQHVNALKTDGTLWSWGSNGNNQLGIGVSGGSYSSPVQVGTLTTWKKIPVTSGLCYGCLALNDSQI